MKILVVDKDITESLRIASVLRALGHDVEVANNGREALVLFGHALPHVVFADVSICLPNGRELVRHIRSLISPHYIYIVMIAADDNEPQITREYEAGVDNEIQPPISQYQLNGRLHAAARILSFEENLRQRLQDTQSGSFKKSDSFTSRSGFYTPQPSASFDLLTQRSGVHAAYSRQSTESKVFCALTPGELVLRSVAWQNLKEDFQSAIGRFLLVDFSVDKISPDEERPSEAYRTVLSNESKQLELHLSTAASQKSLQAFAYYMFGTDRDASRVLEGLSTMLIGTLQKSLAAEHLHFTESIKQLYEAERLISGSDSKQHTETLSFRLGDVCLFVYASVRFKGNSVLPITALQEGMVIGKDILNTKGLLLLSKGTRLSLSMKQRLFDCLPQTHMVEVMVC
jgi:CheY-like chemotaxis protein